MAGLVAMPRAVVRHRQEGPVDGLFCPVAELELFFKLANRVFKPSRAVEGSAVGWDRYRLRGGHSGPIGNGVDGGFCLLVLRPFTSDH